MDTTHSKRIPAHRFECNHRGSLGNQLRFRTVLYSTRVSSSDNKYFTILFLCTRNSSSRRENKTNKQKHHTHCPHRAQMVVEKKDNKVDFETLIPLFINKCLIISINNCLRFSVTHVLKSLIKVSNKYLTVHPSHPTYLMQGGLQHPR